MAQPIKTKKLTTYAMLLAVAFVLSWLESQIPAFFAVPGIKLGLTNLVVMVMLYRATATEAAIINVIRIILVSITFGNLFAALYSLAGGVLSFLVMLILKKSGKFRIITVSIAGGIFHNVGQILVAMFVLESSYIMFYLPALWASGLGAGLVVGLLCGLVTKHLPRNLFE